MKLNCNFLPFRFSRTKNTVNILIKNMLDALIGGVAYWAIGWAVAYGPGGNGRPQNSVFPSNFDPKAIPFFYRLHRGLQLLQRGHGVLLVSGLVFPVRVRRHGRHHRLGRHRREVPVPRLLRLQHPHHRLEWNRIQCCIVRVREYTKKSGEYGPRFLLRSSAVFFSSCSGSRKVLHASSIVEVRFLHFPTCFSVGSIKISFEGSPELKFDASKSIT